MGTKVPRSLFSLSNLLPMAALIRRITTESGQSKLSRLIKDFDEKKPISSRINIPPHQREYCWKLDRQKEFITSILLGYPVPSILISVDDDKRSIEDGRQRLTTARRFTNDEFDIEWSEGNTLYSGLSPIDKCHFDNYLITVQTVYDASKADLIKIFDRIQNGTPLTVGERLYARRDTPLVGLVIRALMTPGTGFHDRAISIWGPRGISLPDKKRKGLLNLTALIAGLAHGTIYVNKKYDAELILRPITEAVEAAVMIDLGRIFEIYEAANEILPSRGRTGSHAKHFDLGTYTGCIMFSLCCESWYSGAVYTPNSISEEKWVITKKKWVDYIVDVRRTMNENTSRSLKSVLEETIHRDASKARMWLPSRWENGYKRVFGIEVDEPAGDEASEYGSFDGSDDE